MDTVSLVLLTRCLCYNNQVKMSTSANDLESWEKGELAIPMAMLRREGVPDSVTTLRREEINDMRMKNNTLHT